MNKLGVFMQTKHLCVLIHSKSVLLLTVPRRRNFRGSFLIFVFRVCRFSCPFIQALWSPTGKGLAFCSLVCDVFCAFVTFPYGVLGQVQCLIGSIPDLWLLS